MAEGGEIYVIGLGPGDPLDLPPVNLSLMRGREVYLRTAHHPVVAYLEREGVQLHPLDRFYEEAASFEEVYRKMTDFLLTAAGQERPLLLGVPGDPLTGETVVQLLLKAAPSRGIRVRLWPAPGFLEAVTRRLHLDPAGGLLVLDGFRLSPLNPPPGAGVLIAQVYSRPRASEVKLSLMEHYPDEHPVTLVQAVGIGGRERVQTLPLYQLDRQDAFDHLTTVYVPPLQAGEKIPEPEPVSCSLDPLIRVMEELLAPGGCPWDRQQTHASLKKYLIEEAYEVTDAIDAGNMYKLCEELGDLLLQVVFHAVLAAKRGDFTPREVVEGIVAKLKRRHPHVFGTGRVRDAAEVVQNWEEIKRQEGEGAAPRSLLAGVPRYLPALQRAQKVQGKAALVGFDWPDALAAADKLREEWQEVRAAWEAGDEAAVRQEVGDLLFAVVNVCRLLGVNAEESLRAAVDKFTWRFCYMEQKAAGLGVSLRDLSPAELDGLWEEAKRAEVAALKRKNFLK